MTGPLRARRDEEPHPDLAQYEQVTDDGDRAARAWFRRTMPGIVPQAAAPPTWAPGPASLDDDRAAGRRRALHAVTDARPAPQPANPAALRTPAEPARQLTQDQISYFLATDPDRFFEEDFDRDLRFDRAIDREPELG